MDFSFRVNDRECIGGKVGVEANVELEEPGGGQGVELCAEALGKICNQRLQLLVGVGLQGEPEVVVVVSEVIV